MDLITNRAIIGTYFQQLEQNEASWINEIALTVPSDQKTEVLAWLDQAPRMRKLEGGRKAIELGEREITIRNDEYESTLDFAERDIRRDKSGQVLSRIREMADGKMDMLLNNITNLMIDGASTAGYDDQYFFDTDHSEGSTGNQSNSINVDISTLPADVHGTVSQPSPKEMQQTILKAVSQILGLRDDKNRPLNTTARKFLVVGPTSLMYAIEEAITMPNIDRGNTNLLAASKRLEIDFAVNPYLDGVWTDKVAVFRTDTAVKPLIITEETGVEATVLGKDSEYYHSNHRMQFGNYWSGGFGYGRWQNACLATMI